MVRAISKQTGRQANEQRGARRSPIHARIAFPNGHKWRSSRAMGYPVRGERGREATRIAGRLASAANRTAPVSIVSAARAAWGVPVHRERLHSEQLQNF